MAIYVLEREAEGMGEIKRIEAFAVGVGGCVWKK